MTIKFQKPQLILIFASILLSVLIIALSCLFLPDKPSAANNPASAAKSCYLLKEYEGRIALYEPPFEVPEEVYSIYVDTLPPADQERLSSGIPIDTPAQLEDYLEDFDS